MKREIDFTPRTAEQSIMVDWPQPQFSVPLTAFPISVDVAWRCLKSLENLVSTQNRRNGAASEERENKF